MEGGATVVPPPGPLSTWENWENEKYYVRVNIFQRHIVDSSND